MFFSKKLKKINLAGSSIVYLIMPLALIPSLIAVCALFFRALYDVRSENSRFLRTVAENIVLDLDEITRKCYGISDFLSEDSEMLGCYKADYSINNEIKTKRRGLMMSRFKAMDTLTPSIRMAALFTQNGEFFNFLSDSENEKDEILKIRELDVENKANGAALVWHPLKENIFSFKLPDEIHSHNFLLGSRRAENQATGEYYATHLFLLPENSIFEYYLDRINNKNLEIIVVDMTERLISSSDKACLKNFGEIFNIESDIHAKLISAVSTLTGWKVYLIEPANATVRDEFRLFWHLTAAIVIEVLVVFLVCYFVSRQLAAKEKHSRDLEIKVLMAQINPHLMYNSLETIVWKANESKTPEIAKIASLLGKLFRISITESGMFQPLEKLINNLEIYIEVEKIRHKDKLNFTMLPFPEEFLSYKAPPMLLQPCFENAIQHGKRSSGETLNITFSIERGGNDLVFTIKDDGAGIEQSRLEKIRAGEYYETRGNRIGIRNIQERMALFFGKNYGLTINSIEGKGTEVIIKIPVIVKI